MSDRILARTSVWFEEGKTGVPKRHCTELTILWGLMEGGRMLRSFLGYPTCSGALSTLASLGGPSMWPSSPGRSGLIPQSYLGLDGPCNFLTTYPGSQL